MGRFSRFFIWIFCFFAFQYESNIQWLSTIFRTFFRIFNITLTWFVVDQYVWTWNTTAGYLLLSLEPQQPHQTVLRSCTQLWLIITQSTDKIGWLLLETFVRNIFFPFLIRSHNHPEELFHHKMFATWIQTKDNTNNDEFTNNRIERLIHGELFSSYVV